MTERRDNINRGWLLLRADGTFDRSDPQQDDIPPGSWVTPARGDGLQVVLIGVPPDTEPVGDDCRH